METKVRTIISPYEYRSAGTAVMYRLFVAVAILMTIAMFYPMFWVFSGSLKDANEIYDVPPSLFPKVWNWGNYKEAWRFYEFPRTMLNSAILFTGYFISKIVVITMAAYSLSRLPMRHRHLVYMIFLATLMLPTVAYLVPSYLVLQRLPVFHISLIDSRFAIWLPAGADSFSLLMIKNFFDTIPKEISESARIDGAGEVKILTSLIMPLSKPIIAVVGIFSFLGIWNDFFWQRLVLISPGKWTMSVMLWFRSTVTGATPPVNIQLAAMFVSIIPPMILFLVFQRSITEGTGLGAIKE